jgi:diacylglycerol O-acyltransferase
MRHLSGIDSAFLYLETPEMPMHVGSLNVYDLPPGYQGDFYEDVKRHIASRMHLAAVFQRKLALMPFELANPVWVDDDDIDLDYHVRRIVLSKPGTMAQLEAYVGRLHSSLLDRSRPLWEFYVIEGLATGQIAFYTKAHHAGMDGAAGVALANAIMDTGPVPRTVRPPPARVASGHYQLGVAELAGAALSNVAVQLVKIVKLVPAVARAAANIALPPKGADGKRRPRLPTGVALGPRTTLNVAITNQRVFAGQSLPLADAKLIARQLNVTLNDVVLALCSGALRRYFEDRGGVPKKSLIAGVPVSLREPGNTEMNNQVTMMLASLASNIADPVERLRAIHASAASSKEFTGNLKAAIPLDFPSLGAPWLMTGLASLYGRSRLANVAISNVPGPQFPLYLAGAKMVSYFPVSIPAHGVALNMTVESYNGSLDFGLTACRRAVPDVREIADHLRGALDELKGLVLAVPAEHAVAAPAKRSATRPGVKAGARRAPVAAAAAKQPGPASAPAERGNGAAKAAVATRRAAARRRRALQAKAA